MTTHSNRTPIDDAGDANSEAGAADSEAGAADSADSAKQAVRQLSALFAELKDYAGYYVEARLDKVKWSVTKLAVFAVLGAVGLLILTALLVTTVVLLLVGAATALGRAFGPEMWWLGWIIVGGVLLLGVGVGLWLAVGAFLRRSGKALVDRYEAKREAQRARYGQHVRSRAADSAHAV